MNRAVRAKLKEAQRSLCKGAGALGTPATINGALEAIQHLTDVLAWIVEAMDKDGLIIGPQESAIQPIVPAPRPAIPSSRVSIENSLKARRNYSAWKEHDLRRALSDATQESRITEASVIEAELRSRGLSVEVMS